MPETPADPSSWHALLADAVEPVFLLNRQRRILLVNRAWEDLIGLSAERARGLACRRVQGGRAESALTAALAPPAEVLTGKTVRVRRRLGGTAAEPRWLDIEFVPLMGADELLAILGRMHGTAARTPAATAPLPERLQSLERRLAGRYRLDGFPCSLPALARAADQARLASQARVSVLVTGEPGTGKEWLARAVHHHGSRAAEAFAAIRCQLLPRQTLVELLQGPGSLLRCRTVGTLYLQEPGCLPLDVQAKLCADLTEPAAERPRVIAGIGTVPDEEVRAGRLLEELRCALGTLEIALPPLRDRPADLTLLVEQFLARSGSEAEPADLGPATETWDALRGYRWPGNLDELYSILLGARRHSKGARIELSDLPAYLRQAVRLEDTPGRSPPRQIPLKRLRDQVERRLIALALRMAKGNKSEAARLLAIERLSLLSRLKALGMEQKSESQDQKAEPGPRPSAPKSETGSA